MADLSREERARARHEREREASRRYRAKRDRARAALEAAASEGRNVLPDATDDQAHVIEAWAQGVLG